MPESNTPIELSLLVITKMFERAAPFHYQALSRRRERNRKPGARLPWTPCRDKFSSSARRGESNRSFCDTLPRGAAESSETYRQDIALVRRSKAACEESARASPVSGRECYAVHPNSAMTKSPDL